MTDFVEKAKRGSEKAFMVLVDGMKHQLYKTAFVKLRNEEDALDAVQEALIKAFSSIGSLRENRFFKTWLIRILLNECHNIKKYKNKVIPTEDHLIELKHISESDSIETLDIHNVLNQLDDIYKEVIDLRYNHDLKFYDIAKILDIPLGTVKSRLNRAHSLLRNHLKDSEDYERKVLS